VRDGDSANESEVVIFVLCVAANNRPHDVLPCELTLVSRRPLHREGQKLAHFYFENEPGRRSAASLLTKDEASQRAVANSCPNERH